MLEGRSWALNARRHQNHPKNKLYHFPRFLAARPSVTCNRPKKANIWTIKVLAFRIPLVSLAESICFDGCKNPSHEAKKNTQVGVFPKIGGKPPKWMVYFMENLIKTDDLGGPSLFLETPKWGWEGKFYIGIQIQAMLCNAYLFPPMANPSGKLHLLCQGCCCWHRYLLLGISVISSPFFWLLLLIETSS